MDPKDDIREFLTTRRARLTPEQVGLPDYGTRRVPGLRREEVAVLAGVSVPYYTRLERGSLAGVSDGVLEALARALRLDEAERAHLLDLACAAQPTAVAPRRRRAKQRVRPSVQHTLDAITGAPAIVANDRLDFLGANALGHALFPMIFEGGLPVSSARFVFLDPRAKELYLDWEQAATDVVAALRIAAGRNPFDRDLSDMVGELSTRSEAFRTRWGAHDVRFHTTGTKRFDHPAVGELSLTFEILELAADPGLALFVLTAEPGSRSEEGLRLLASWAATAAAERVANP